MQSLEGPSGSRRLTGGASSQFRAEVRVNFRCARGDARRDEETAGKCASCTEVIARIALLDKHLQISNLRMKLETCHFLIPACQFARP